MNFTRVRYRIAQFFQAVRAYFRPVDYEYASRSLSLPLLSLFRRMSRVEQQHSLALCQTLEAQGYHAPELLMAALLHDLGKVVVPPRLWERVWVVLGEHYFPTRAAHWAQGTAQGMRRGFVSRQQHPTWGAQLAEESGAPARTVSLIRRHHSPPGDDKELAALQAADNN
ncbi:MAG: HD domain-containing protein [Chloroflexota bacterium]|nr:HD domain-containing protein [Chloroflexota bacterium]